MFDGRETGERIRNSRKELGLGRNEFSQLVGIFSGFVAQIERGTRFLSVGNLLKISEVLGASTDYILLGKGKVTKLTMPKEKIIYTTKFFLTDLEADFFIDIYLILKRYRCKPEELKIICSLVYAYLKCKKD